MDERKSKFIARLEATGESGVRENLELKRYGNDHIGWATLWLADLEQDRAAAATASHNKLIRSQAIAAQSQAEAARIQAEEATEANRIARLALDKAQTANTIATLALVGAAIAISVSVITAFLS